VFINPCGIFFKACFHLIDVPAVCGSSCSTTKRCGIGRSNCGSSNCGSPNCGGSNCGGPSFSTTNRCSSNCSTYGVQQNVVRSAVVARAANQTGTTLEPKLGPSIPPLQEVAYRAHVSKRDQFWDQFRGAGSGVSIFLTFTRLQG
jgi:hypothetical protein